MSLPPVPRRLNATVPLVIWVALPTNVVLGILLMYDWSLPMPDWAKIGWAVNDSSRVAPKKIAME